MTQDPFREYIRQQEPGKKEKGYAWSTACKHPIIFRKLP